MERARGPGRDGAGQPRDRLGRHLDVGGAGRELGRAVTRRSGLRTRLPDPDPAPAPGEEAALRRQQRGQVGAAKQGAAAHQQSA